MFKFKVAKEIEDVRDWVDWPILGKPGPDVIDVRDTLYAHDILGETIGVYKGGHIINGEINPFVFNDMLDFG